MSCKPRDVVATFCFFSSSVEVTDGYNVLKIIIQYDISTGHIH